MKGKQRIPVNWHDMAHDQMILPAHEMVLITLQTKVSKRNHHASVLLSVVVLSFRAQVACTCGIFFFFLTCWHSLNPDFKRLNFAQFYTSVLLRMDKLNIRPYQLASPQWVECNLRFCFIQDCNLLALCENMWHVFYSWLYTDCKQQLFLHITCNQASGHGI